MGGVFGYCCCIAFGVYEFDGLDVVDMLQGMSMPWISGFGGFQSMIERFKISICIGLDSYDKVEA